MLLLTKERCVLSGARAKTKGKQVFYAIVEDCLYFAELLHLKIYWNDGIFFHENGKYFQVQDIFEFRGYLVNRLRGLKQLHS